MAQFLIRPNKSGYSHQQASEALTADVEGGMPRVRRDVVGAVFLVNVSWVFDAEQYDYACAFKRTATDHQSLPFDIELILDSAAVAVYEAKFVPGSWQLTGQSGLAYMVSAQLWVTAPINPDEATDDQTIIDAYEEAYGP
jgi:hypothetical protein